MNQHKDIPTSIAPWISVTNSATAVSFYLSAFGAIEKYRLQDPEGKAVVRLSVDGADFWVSDAPGGDKGAAISSPGPVRMILTVADPDAVFGRALQAGATEISPVSEVHGWRVGRLADPSGIHWEIGRQIG